MTVSLEAQEIRFLGPIRVRDLSPIAALRLDFVPAHGFQEARGGWAFRINYSLANVFIVSDAVADYLEENGEAELLSPEDIEAILRRPGDIFFFDGEVSTIDLEYIHAVSPRLQVQVAWPLQIRGGGYLDRFIEGFHEAVGLNTAHRDLTARNDVQVVMRIGSDTLVLSEPGTVAGTGDPSISLRHHTKLPRALHLTAEAAAKIPIGEEERFFSSGELDYGMQLSLQKQLQQQAFYLGASYIWVGDIRVFPNFPLNDAPTITTAWERRVGQKNWAIVQGSWSRSTLQGAAASALTEDRTQVTLGWRRRLGSNVVATAAVTENVINFKNTPDFGIHLAMGWLFPKL